MTDQEFIEAVFRSEYHPAVQAWRELYRKGAVTVQQVKDYFKLAGFHPTNQSSYSSASTRTTESTYNPNTTEIPQSGFTGRGSFTSTDSTAVPASQTSGAQTIFKPEESGQQKPFYKQPLFIVGSIIAGGFIIKKLLK